MLGDSVTISRSKPGYWKGYQNHDRDVYHVMLTDIAATPRIHTNLFSSEQTLEKGF